MPFALRTKDRARNGGNVRLVQQNLRRNTAILVDLLYIRKSIERARKIRF